MPFSYLSNQGSVQNKDESPSTPHHLLHPRKCAPQVGGGFLKPGPKPGTSSEFGRVVFVTLMTAPEEEGYNDWETYRTVSKYALPLFRSYTSQWFVLYNHSSIPTVSRAKKKKGESLTFTSTMSRS